MIMKLFVLFPYFFLYLVAGKQTPRSNCCRRIPHTYNIGYDITGRPLQLDVGRCSASCENTDVLRSTSYISVLARIRERKGNSAESLTCQTHTHHRGECQPSVVHVEAVAFDRGPKYYDVIDECSCRRTPKRCERIPKMKRFFAGTGFEATVDVGQCAGGCRKEKSGKGCRPTRTASRPILGPNGMITVHTIAECNCQPTCYRQHFNVAVTERAENESTGEYTFRTKVIDVGRCVGTCGPIERCVVRSNKRNQHTGDTKCLMSLETADVTCAPTRVNDVTYVGRSGEVEHVAQIRRCGCT
ncbi:uncharacterized protein LOC100183487 [Ciona intestinalis]